MVNSSGDPSPLALLAAADGSCGEQLLERHRVSTSDVLVTKLDGPIILLGIKQLYVCLSSSKQNKFIARHAGHTSDKTI